jgi:methionyl-tRNA formyltransferase
MKTVFFGTSRFSVIVLEELKSLGLLPDLVVTTEDKPQGRKLVVTPNPVKIWADQNNIPYLQPKKLDSEFTLKLSTFNFQLSIVASYGKIIPKNILEIPKHGTLNVHPSMLPKWRGASPIQSTILHDNQAAVTIIQLDEEMDHGPILTQSDIVSWDNTTIPYYPELEENLAKIGAKILFKAIPDFVSGKTELVEQNHSQATYCTKIEKSLGELNLEESAETNLRKIRAYSGTINTYFLKNNKRVVVKTARIENNTLVIERVVPEGKKEMNYSDYLRGN